MRCVDNHSQVASVRRLKFSALRPFFERPPVSSAVDHDARGIQALNPFGQALSEFPEIDLNSAEL